MKMWPYTDDYVIHGIKANSDYAIAMQTGFSIVLPFHGWPYWVPNEVCWHIKICFGVMRSKPWDMGLPKPWDIRP